MKTVCARVLAVRARLSVLWQQAMYGMIFPSVFGVTEPPIKATGFLDGLATWAKEIVLGLCLVAFFIVLGQAAFSRQHRRGSTLITELGVIVFVAILAFGGKDILNWGCVNLSASGAPCL